MNRIKKISEEIYQKYNVIREIDFERDIDIEKSDRFFIDEGKKYLEFLCADVEKTVTSDYLNIIGSKEAKGDHIKFIDEIPTNFNLHDRSINVLHDRYINVLIQKSINTALVDGFFIRFMEKTETEFSIGLVNRKFYEVLLKIFNRQLPLGRQAFTLDDTKRIIFDFKSGSYVKASYFYKNMIQPNFHTIINTNEYIEYVLFDFRNAFIAINGKKKIFNMPNTFLEKQMFINITHFNRGKNDDSGSLSFKLITYYKKEGYVYLKPIELMNQRNKMFIIHKGDPEFEIYSHNSKKWVMIENDSIIEDETITIRAKMSMGDRIYRIAIASID